MYTHQTLPVLFSVFLVITTLINIVVDAASGFPFSLGIRDSIMIAHSFKGEQFGPAQNIHGATYTVDVTFRSKNLVPKNNWVIDIGEASTALSRILSKYNFKNLDQVFPEGENTTTEFMCRAIHRDLAAHFCTNRAKSKEERFKGSICVKLWESHKAWACYEAIV